MPTFGPPKPVSLSPEWDSLARLIACGHNGKVMFSRAIESRRPLLFAFCLILAGLSFARAEEDEVSEMLEVLTRQIEAAPNNTELLLQRARMFIVAKKYDQAMADLNLANRIRPTAELQREKARVLIEAGWSEDGLKQADTYIAA